MLVATYNINNVNLRLPNLISWLKAAKADIVCLQELKTSDRSFPARDLAKAGYESAWVGQKTWNGVAIISRVGQPIVTRIALPGDADDRQSRYIEAAVCGIIIASIYAPNGNPQPGPKFDYKLSWLARLHRPATTLRKSGAPVVLAGDYNVVPTDFDIYDMRSWRNDALVQPKSRAAFKQILGRSWTDALRLVNPDDPAYTFWSYFRNRWERNAGLRIDHLLVSSNLKSRIIGAGVDRWVRGVEGASDHAPAWIEIAD